MVSEDVENFEYTPRPEFEGPFEVFNEANEVGAFGGRLGSFFGVIVRFLEDLLMFF